MCGSADRLVGNSRCGGIYIILNTVNSKVYVGSSKALANRISQHKRLLVNSAHHSKHLQRSWDKYGADSFRFCVIEFAEDIDLLPREQYWIDTLEATDINKGYNICRIAGSSAGISRSEEHKHKNRVSHLGRKHTKEAKAKIGASSLGRMHTEESKEKIRRNNSGKIVSAEVRTKISKSLKGRPARNKGVSPSDEARTKMSLARTGKSPINKGLPRSEEDKAKMSAGVKAYYRKRKELIVVIAYILLLSRTEQTFEYRR